MPQLNASTAIGVDSCLPMPLCDVLELIRWIGDVTGEPIPEVARRMQKEVRHIGHNVAAEMQSRGITPHLWSDQLIDFYQTTNAFLYETSVWNGTSMKIGMRRWIGRFLSNQLGTGSRMLAFGDGMGFDSAFLADLGFVVDCFEVSEQCLKFAARVFEANGVDVGIIRDESLLDAASYDGIVCLDVLEHVPDPVEIVKKFSGWLRPGGYLVVNAPFCYVGPAVPTHLDRNRQYSGNLSQLYRPYGFTPVASLGLWCPLALQKTGAAQPYLANWRERAGVLAGAVLLSPARLSPLVYKQAARWMVRPNAAWSDAIGKAIEQIR